MIRAAFAVAAVLATTLAAPLTGGALERVEREVYLMGTQARLETYAGSRPEGLATLDRALVILEQTEDELSTWREHSAISVLNRQPVGMPWKATQRLCVAFDVVFGLSRETDYAFDPAIGTLTDAWGIHEGGRLPSPAALSAARRASGLRLLDFDRRDCTVTRRADVRLDVGAWGKGEGIDRVRAAVPEAAWSIDLGGQIAVSGLPPGQTAWKLSVAHPHHRNEPVLSVRLRGGSLSTSAGSERDLIVDGRRVAHHLDPRTGEPVSFTGSVSVWHSSALAADALSTALYVMGPDAGLAWAEERGIAACFLTPDAPGLIVKMTAAFRPLTAPGPRTALSR